MFFLYQAVQGEIIAQVIAPVDPHNLASLSNANTSQYGDNILKILQHQSTTYGHITLSSVPSDLCMGTWVSSSQHSNMQHYQKNHSSLQPTLVDSLSQKRH